MKVPVSWLKEFVDVDVSIPELAHRLTLAGLEVEEIRYVGLPLPDDIGEGSNGRRGEVDTNVTGIGWDPEKIVVGAVLEVMPHRDADRLVLCRIDDGKEEHIVVTGAPNLFAYKGKGSLQDPLKVAYAMEGARLYDGHSPGQKLFTLKRAKIRGVESYSMACSEKELGISDDHEGVIILDDDAPVGMPLVDYMGDAVLDITLTPNMARNANVIGIARETAAVTGGKFREPDYEVPWEGEGIAGRVRLEIRVPELNPRFVLGLIEGIEVGPSPYWVQRRLQLAGMRPINNIVDASNYVMLEVGEPLHAFDYDVLTRRAGGEAPLIITRLAQPGERLKTLDDVEREMDDFTVMVADTAGSLSIAGVMGGAESEVSRATRNVLLEGAAWNYINVRKTVAAQNLASEASYRFERGVHPAMAERGVKRGLQMMAVVAGGRIAKGLVDEYPLPPEESQVEITPQDCERWLGIRLETEEIAQILRRLEFQAEVKRDRVIVRSPDYRLDIGTGIIGKADLMEEIARLYGYDRIPETMISDEIPHQRTNAGLEFEERIRDILVNLGLQEVVTYRLTTEGRERRSLPPGTPGDDRPYIELANPITSERVALRHSILTSLLEVAEKNTHIRDRLALFETGPVYLPSEEGNLPEESPRLGLLLTGRRYPPSWQGEDLSRMDFYDLKAILESLLNHLHVGDVRFEAVQHPSYHPGKCARVTITGQQVGIAGEIHPLVQRDFGFSHPVVAAELDLSRLLPAVPARSAVRPVLAFPPVLEDIAVVTDEEVLAEEVESVIRSAGGAVLVEIRLFDLYRGEQVGPGKKSLAYALTFQAADRTLTDEEVARVRARIVQGLEKELNAQLRA
jgi:phenylalanyl-tRNA synthetase beta chain